MSNSNQPPWASQTQHLDQGQQYQPPQGQHYQPQPSRIAGADPAHMGSKLPFFKDGNVFVLDLEAVKEFKTSEGKEFFCSEWKVIESTDPSMPPGLRGAHKIHLNGRYADGPGKAAAFARLVMESLYQQPAMTFDNEQVGKFLAYGYSSPDWSKHPIRMVLTTVLNKTGTYTYHNYEGKPAGYTMGLTPQTPTQAPPPQEQQYQPPRYQEGNAPTQAPPPQEQQYQPPQPPVQPPAGGIKPPWES